MAVARFAGNAWVAAEEGRGEPVAVVGLGQVLAEREPIEDVVDVVRVMTGRPSNGSKGRV